MSFPFKLLVRRSLSGVYSVDIFGNTTEMGIPDKDFGTWLVSQVAYPPYQNAQKEAEAYAEHMNKSSSNRRNEYDALKARVAELETELLKKHQDTQRIDWLENFYKSTDEEKRWLWNDLEVKLTTLGFRNGIDAARKNGGAA